MTYTPPLGESHIRRNYDRHINSQEGQKALYDDLAKNHNTDFTKPAVIWFDFNGDLAEDAEVYKFLRENKGKCTSSTTFQGKDEL